MSTLDKDSTLQQRTDAYYDNASYDEDNSATKAAAFKTAIIHLLAGPERIRIGNEEMQFSHLTMRMQLEDVRRWLSANGPAGAVLHPDLSDYRD